MVTLGLESLVRAMFRDDRHFSAEPELFPAFGKIPAHLYPSHLPQMKNFLTAPIANKLQVLRLARIRLPQSPKHDCATVGPPLGIHRSELDKTALGLGPIVMERSVQSGCPGDNRRDRGRGRRSHRVRGFNARGATPGGRRCVGNGDAGWFWAVFRLSDLNRVRRVRRERESAHLFGATGVGGA